MGNGLGAGGVTQGGVRPFSGLTDLIAFPLSFFPLPAAFLVLFAISNSLSQRITAVAALDFWPINRTVLRSSTQQAQRNHLSLDRSELIPELRREIGQCDLAGRQGLRRLYFLALAEFLGCFLRCHAFSPLLGSDPSVQRRRLTGPTGPPRQRITR